MMVVFLLVCLVCLIPPFTPLGVGGLLAWLICAVSFAVGNVGEEQMTTEIQSGNSGCGFVWLVLVSILVLLGGGAAFALLATMANAGR